MYDAYEDDKKYKSYWKFNKETNNIELVNKTNWFRRLNILKETIEYWCNNTNKNTKDKLIYNFIFILLKYNG